MKPISARLAVVAAALVIAQALSLRTAAAHTSGEGADVGHLLVEFGLWGLGAVGVLAAIVAVFWIRNKMWPQ